MRIDDSHWYTWSKWKLFLSILQIIFVLPFTPSFYTEAILPECNGEISTIICTILIVLLMWGVLICISPVLVPLVYAFLLYKQKKNGRKWMINVLTKND